MTSAGPRRRRPSTEFRSTPRTTRTTDRGRVDTLRRWRSSENPAFAIPSTECRHRRRGRGAVGPPDRVCVRFTGASVGGLDHRRASQISRPPRKNAHPGLAPRSRRARHCPAVCKAPGRDRARSRVETWTVLLGLAAVTVSSSCPRSVGGRNGQSSCTPCAITFAPAVHRSYRPRPMSSIRVDVSVSYRPREGRRCGGR